MITLDTTNESCSFVTEESMEIDLKFTYKLVVKINNTTEEQNELFNYFLHYLENELWDSDCKIFYNEDKLKIELSDINVYIKETIDIINKLQNLRNICLTINDKISIVIYGTLLEENIEECITLGYIYVIDKNSIYKLDLEDYLEEVILPK